MKALKYIPNILTVSRIIVIPFILAAMCFLDSVISHKVAAILFLYACITDYLDGAIARTYSVQSNFGKFLDPIADKLLVGAVILVLVYYDRVDLLPSIAIICREILVSGLREFLAEIRVSVPVSRMAKIKTGVQMVAIFILVLGDKGSGIVYASMVGRVLIWIAAGITLFTGYAYLKASFKHFSVVEN